VTNNSPYKPPPLKGNSRPRQNISTLKITACFCGFLSATWAGANVIHNFSFMPHAFLASLLILLFIVCWNALPSIYLSIFSFFVDINARGSWIVVFVTLVFLLFMRLATTIDFSSSSTSGVAFFTVPLLEMFVVFAVGLAIVLTERSREKSNGTEKSNGEIKRDGGSFGETTR